MACLDYTASVKDLIRMCYAAAWEWFDTKVIKQTEQAQQNYIIRAGQRNHIIGFL